LQVAGDDLDVQGACFHFVFLQCVAMYVL
jgi:hypothetical protein